MQNLKRNWLVISKLTWREHLKVPKIFILMCSFRAKYILFELKKYRGVIFHETEEGYKFWNWHKECGKFWPEHSKISKIFTLMGFFRAKYILFKLKKYKGIIFHETEEGYKIRRGTGLSFQNWRKQFDKFWPEHSKVLKIFTLIGPFYTFFHFNRLLLYIFWAKKVQRGYLSWNWRGIQNLERIHLSFQDWHKEFDEFWPEPSEVLKIFTLIGSFWAKYTFFELKKYRGVTFHETEEGYKIWRGIDFSFQNWHKEFDKFWPEHSKVSKIFTLMGSFCGKYMLFELKK